MWDDDHIRSLLASVSISYPVGAVMMLQTGNPAVRFKPRVVEGVNLDHPVEPERLIPDGQQRLTALARLLDLDNIGHHGPELARRVREGIELLTEGIRGMWPHVSRNGIGDALAGVVRGR